MQGLYRRRLTWWFRYRRNGKRMFVNLHTHDEAEAIALAREELRAADLAAPDTWQPEIDRYLASFTGKSANYLRDLRSVLEKISEQMLERDVRGPGAVRSTVLRQWIAAEAARGIRPATVRAYADALRRLLAWLVEHRRIVATPFAEVPLPFARPAVRRRFLAPEEAEKLLEACADEGLRFAVMCALHAGLRKEEIIEARAEWFDLAAGLLHIQASAHWHPKDGDARTIPLTDALAAFVRSYGLREPYMLRPEVKRGRARYRYDFRKAFVAAVTAAGLSCTFHDLRRTFASTLVSRGVSVYKVAQWMGTDVDIVQQHYGHLRAQDDEINLADPSRAEPSAPTTKGKTPAKKSKARPKATP